MIGMNRPTIVLVLLKKGHGSERDPCPYEKFPLQQQAKQQDFISWFPQFLTQVLLHPGVGVKVDIYIRYFTFVMFYLNLVFDPLVYTLHHNAKLLCCGVVLCKEKSNSETLVSNVK